MLEGVEEIKENIIRVLCKEVGFLELTGRAVKPLEQENIKYIASLLTYSDAELRADVFKGNGSALNDLYSALNDENITKWFSPLIEDQSVRDIQGSEELRAYLENQPFKFFERMLSDNEVEQDNLALKERERAESEIRRALPKKLKQGLSKVFYDRVIRTLVEKNTSPEDAIKEVVPVLLNGLGLNKND